MRPTAPILVTGVPRSGTTWLARLLADSHHTCEPGREPMNPRGRQHALGGTLSRWSRVTALSVRQELALKTAYQGINPWTFSRFGHRQIGALLPSSRIVVKDPFALLSLPHIVDVTQARVVLVYRHPGAVLASYRRMGWSVDLRELITSLVVDEWHTERRWSLIEQLERVRSEDDVEQMAAFWNVLHVLALSDLPAGSLVVSHQDLAAGGVSAVNPLFENLGLEFTSAVRSQLTQESPAEITGTQLHRLNRSPAEVAESWRRDVDPTTVDVLEAGASEGMEQLEAANLIRRPGA